MKTALERLEELEKQLAATQVAHVELELRVTLHEAILGHLVATGRVPTPQQLAQLQAGVIKRMSEKYPGLHVEVQPPTPAQMLFVPNGTGPKLV